MKYAIRAAVLAAAFCAGPSGAQDYDKPATYGDVELAPGFTPNPKIMSLSAGGSKDADALGGECTGMVADEPDVQLEWKEGQPRLVLTATSDADVSLVVNNPDGDWLCDDDSGDGTDAQLDLTDAESGTYDIWVGVVDGANLPKATLQISNRIPGAAPAAPAVAAAGAGDGVRVERGTLAAGDGTYQTGEYRDRFTFSGQTGDQVIVDLRSNDFDSYLIVTAPNGQNFVNNDYEGSTSRSLLNVTLPQAGDYTVNITSQRPRETGAYSVTIGNQSGAAMEPLIERRGALMAGDMTRMGGEYFDVYEFRGAPGRHVTIDLTSDAFDPYLIMIAPSGALTENDDRDNSTDSRIEADLSENGIYRVRASAYEKDETGAYALKIVNAAPLSIAQQVGRDTANLTLGQAVNGRLQQGDQEPEAGKYQDVYAFQGSAGQSVRVDLTSGDFDTFVALKTPNGTVVDNDDFESSTSRSVVDLALTETGRYQIIVSSYDDDETGAYRLLASLSANAPVVAAPATRETAPAGRGNVYGVFAGISTYNGRMNDLDYTADDPVFVRDALIANARMPRANAITLTNGQATTTALREAFRTLGQRMGPNDIFVFFFSGHGGQVDRPSGPDSFDADGLDETIELYDASLLDNDLSTMLGQIRGRSLVILDSCFSGGFAKDLVSSPGRMGLFSSEEDVTSLVADKFRAGGYLSIFFKEAIEQGRADGDMDRAINAVELSQYLHERYRGEASTKAAAAPRYVDSQNFGYQHLVVDRGGIRPYDVIFTMP